MKYKLYQPQTINEMGSRKNQEDFIYPASGKVTADSRVFVVCDGMGGYEKGEVASSIVANTVGEYMEQHGDTNAVVDDSVFIGALATAFDALDAASQQESNKMGTTFTAICLHRGGCTAAHIGDSRIYHLRPSTNEILYRSRDHSLVHDLYEMGQISYGEMKTSHQKNIIMRAMLPRQEVRSKPDLVHITDIRPGDYFYLCTDGMLEQMEDEQLMEILADKDTDDEQKRQRLISETAGNADNHSAYLIHVESVENEESDALQPNDEPQARAANKALNDPDRHRQPDDEEEVSVFTAVNDDQPAVRQQRRPVAQPPRKKTNKWVLPLIILLVAIITGFTIINLMSRKKEVPVKQAVPPEDPNRVEYLKEDPGQTSSQNGRTAPARPFQSAAPVRDRQTEEVENIFNNQAKREKDKERAEQEKAEKAEKAKAEEEARKKAAAQQQPAQPAQKEQETKGTLHVSEDKIRFEKQTSKQE